jgi:hypothetical protein
MCFVIELQHPRVPLRIGVNPPSGKGIVLRQEGVVDAKSALNANHTASRTKLASHAQRAKDVLVNFS